MDEFDVNQTRPFLFVFSFTDRRDGFLSVDEVRTVTR